MLYQTPDRACACLPVLCLPVLPACLLFPTPERPLISDLTASAPVEPAGCWLPACVLACLFLPPVSLPTKRPRLTVGSPVEPPQTRALPRLRPGSSRLACVCYRTVPRPIDNPAPLPRHRENLIVPFRCIVRWIRPSSLRYVPVHLLLSHVAIRPALHFCCALAFLCFLFLPPVLT